MPPLAVKFVYNIKIAVSTDERIHLVDVILDEWKRRGHEVVYFGPEQREEAVDWPEVTLEAVNQQADEAIAMCWTGTGCTIVANKVPGIRMALCRDADACIWNHANVLGLGLRATPEPMVKDILNRWFDKPFSNDEWNLRHMAHLREIEKRVDKCLHIKSIRWKLSAECSVKISRTAIEGLK